MTLHESTPYQNTRDFAAFSALVYCQFGAVLWDFVTTCEFDVSIFRGKKPWAWPMVAYFITRYGSFVALIPLLMQINAFGVNCSSIWPAIIVGIKMQKLGAEALFGIRAMALFEYHWAVVSCVTLLWTITAIIGLLSIRAATWAHQPAPVPGLSPSCVPLKWEWELGVAYILTLVFACVVISLVVYRLHQMGRKVRSSLSSLIYRDGILFLILAIGPTIAAVVLFYAGKTPPAQSAPMTLAATIHSLLAARAYRNLSDLCERLPVSMRLKVSNGTRLDADTLGRIAFIMGAPHEHSLEQGRKDSSQQYGGPEYQNAFAYGTSESKDTSSWSGSPRLQRTTTFERSPQLKGNPWDASPVVHVESWNDASDVVHITSNGSHSLSNMPAQPDAAASDVQIITQQEILRVSTDSSKRRF